MEGANGSLLSIQLGQNDTRTCTKELNIWRWWISIDFVILGNFGAIKVLFAFEEEKAEDAVHNLEYEAPAFN